MERKENFPSASSCEGNGVGLNDALFIPKSGFTKSFYLKCLDGEEQIVSFVALLMFASEGDNSNDAIRLASHVNDWLNLIPINTSSVQGQKYTFTFPVSWNALFGNAAPKVIF